MSKRWIAVCALSVSLMLAPARSHAQVAEVLLKCTRSLSVAVTCVIIDQGVEQVVEVSIKTLAKIAYGGWSVVQPGDIKPAPEKAAEVRTNTIDWAKLKEFLLSVFNAGTPVDEAQAREKIAASCEKNYVPVCRYLGVPEPRQFVDCTKITTKDACDVAFVCSWKGSSCSRHGGTKELLGR